MREDAADLRANLPPWPRVSLFKPFTTMESLVVALIVRGENYYEVAKRLHIKRTTVNMHAKNAARKIPGDDTLKPQTKLHFWARGATLEQLTGEAWLPTPPSK
jgi:DNA-binding NarL/FixJ family response regulator